MKPLCINTASLSSKTHRFSFSLGVDFLREYSGGLAPDGSFSAQVVLTRRTTLIEAHFSIMGSLQLVCDRSLETFDYPMDIKKRIIFKYGDEARELSDDVMLIDRKATDLEVGQLLYELIGLAIPMKKLHPDFRDVSTNCSEDEMVYSTSSSKERKNNPVWQKLRLQHK